MENKDQPAFPAMDFNHYSDGSGQLELRYPGLSKREYFAGLAMQGMLSACVGISGDIGSIRNLSELAVKQADAILSSLSSKGGGE